jgi:O-acetyl-ADP-ribose deacetylase (regulator of RNase III)
MTRIVLLEGDLTEQETDAIVNAANASLILGSGVAGAISSRGGPRIAEECSRHGRIPVGSAVQTTAGDLPAGCVIHAAGIDRPGGEATEENVRSAVRSALALAAEAGLRSIALPAIGAGVGGFSLQRCAEISLEEARAAAEAGTSLEEIRFVLLGEPAYRLFEMVQDAAKVEAQMRRLRDR